MMEYDPKTGMWETVVKKKKIVTPSTRKEERQFAFFEDPAPSAEVSKEDNPVSKIIKKNWFTKLFKRDQ